MRITRRQFSAASLAAMTQTRPAVAASRPNIVVILADDLGYADLGFQGCRDIQTPHLNSLAGSGVRFTSGYVSHPFCSPTRAGLMTGRYQQRFGHENNMKFKLNDEVAGLPLSEATLPSVLSNAGYVTGLVGKWHLGVHPRFHPLKRGFREMFGFLGGGHDYFHPGAEGEDRELFLPILRNTAVVAEKEYLTTALGREAAAFVRRHQRTPFFLYLSFNAPHTPLQAPDTYVNRFARIGNKDRRVYAAMVSAMDDAIGQVLGALRQAQLEEETLIFFLSDNGGPTGNASDNRPLRGTKRTLYDGGIRVPFVIRWPGRLPKGKTIRDPIISLDIFPTALAAAGVAAPGGNKLDGVNLLPLLEGRSAPAQRRQLFWRTFGGVHFAAREGALKLVRNADAPPELYDVERDAGETKNLAASRPDELRRLQAAMDAWNQDLATPLWPDHIFHREAIGQ